jgi:hypothetical protein
MAINPLFIYRIVPTRVCLLAGRSSIKYKKHIEHLPTPENPRKNITVIVISTDDMKKVAIMLSNCSKIENKKMGFLP